MSLENDIKCVLHTFSDLIPGEPSLALERICAAAREAEGLRERIEELENACQDWGLKHSHQWGEAQEAKRELASLRTSDAYRLGKAVMAMPQGAALYHRAPDNLGEWLFGNDASNNRYASTPLAALQAARIGGEKQ